MGLKILHSADWHLDSPFTGLPDDRREYLKNAQRRLPGRIVALAKAEGCDLVLLSGDLFDGNCSRDTLDAVRRALADCAVPVFIAPGNHDPITGDSPWQQGSWPENVHIFGRELTCVVLPELGCRVYGAGYGSMDCPGLLENFHGEGEEMYRLCVLHGDPVQPNSPYCPVTASQVRASGLTYLALGHIHKAGSFRAGETLCAWPGCPMGRGWDETGEKGVYIVTLGEKAEAAFHPLDTPRFYVLEAESSEALEAQLPAAGNEHFYRVTLTGCNDWDIPDLQDRFPHMTFLDCREEVGDLWEHAGEDTLEGIFFQMLKQSGQTEEVVNLAARLARRLLDGREVKLP